MKPWEKYGSGDVGKVPPWERYAPQAPEGPQGPGLLGSVPVDLPGEAMDFSLGVPPWLEAGAIGAGRMVNRLEAGIRDRLNPVADVATEQAEAKAAYAPLQESNPIATAVGESVPYFAVPMGALGRPVAALGQAATRAAPMLGGAAMRAGNLAARPTVDAALTGGLLGAIDVEGSAVGGAAGGAAGGALGALATRFLRPFTETISEAVAAPARRLGARLTAGERTGSRALKLIESSLESSPFSAGAFARLRNANQGVVNKAALKAIGEAGEEVSEEAIDRAFTRIGGEFDSLTKGKTVALGRKFAKSLDKIEGEYSGNLVKNDTLDPVIERVRELAAKGKISGEDYQKFVSELGKKGRSAFRGQQSDPDFGHALFGIKDALDDAMERSLGKTARRRFKDARVQYRNLMALMAPGVVNEQSGNVSAAVLGNTLKRLDKHGFRRGKNVSELYDAGRLGKAFPRVVGESGTAPRMALPLLATGTGGALAGAQLGQGDPGEALLYGLAPAAMLALAGRGYTSPAVQGYLTRGLLPPLTGLLTDAGRGAITSGAGRLGAAQGAGLLAQ